MTVLYNHKMMEARRRELRQKMTEAEERFWSVVRRQQILNTKFRRQYSVKAFVVDFYAAIPRLAVEIDGDYHLEPEAMAHDFIRQVEIENCGITVLRFTNHEVFTDLDRVITCLSETLRKLLILRSHSSP